MLAKLMLLHDGRHTRWRRDALPRIPVLGNSAEQAGLLGFSQLSTLIGKGVCCRKVLGAEVDGGRAGQAFRPLHSYLHSGIASHPRLDGRARGAHCERLEATFPSIHLQCCIMMRSLLLQP